VDVRMGGWVDVRIGRFFEPLYRPKISCQLKDRISIG